MRVSDVLPGNVNDLAAARESVLETLRLFVEKMPALADGGYEGAGHGILTPVKKPAGMKELDINAARGTRSSGPCGAWESAASRSSPSGGKRSSTSP